MNLRSSLLGQLVVFAVSVAISAYYATILPDRVPSHWNIHGQIDQYGNKWVSLAMMPGTILFIAVLSLALPHLSPKNFEVTRSGKAYGEVMLLVSALMGTLHVIILAGTANAHIDMTRWFFAGFFLFFALMGNLLGKIKRNFYMGVRTPWTLADERVWTETHRITAHQWFICGIVGGILTLVGVPATIMIAYLVVMALVPVPMSFILYKRLNRT
jgi:uncharacterized membrane protein